MMQCSPAFPRRIGIKAGRQLIDEFDVLALTYGTLGAMEKSVGSLWNWRNRLIAISYRHCLAHSLGGLLPGCIFGEAIVPAARQASDQSYIDFKPVGVAHITLPTVY